jgi:beta-galactosidase
LLAGCGAIWIRAQQQPGPVVLRATHPVLGTREVQLRIEAAEPELA